MWQQYSTYAAELFRKGSHQRMSHCVCMAAAGCVDPAQVTHRACVDLAQKRAQICESATCSIAGCLMQGLLVPISQQCISHACCMTYLAVSLRNGTTCKHTSRILSASCTTKIEKGFVHTLATFSATRYFCPSFSSSASTQSVMHGVHSAYRQSIIPDTRSICKPIHQSRSPY